MVKRKTRPKARKPPRKPIGSSELVERLGKETKFNLRIISQAPGEMICKWWSLEFRFSFTNKYIYVECAGHLLDGVPVEENRKFSNPPDVRQMASFIREMKKMLLRDVPPELRRQPTSRLVDSSGGKVTVRNPAPPKLSSAEDPTFDTEEEFLRASWHSTDYG